MNSTRCGDQQVQLLHDKARSSSSVTVAPGTRTTNACRVIVRADYDDLRTIPGNFRLDIVTRLSARLITVSSGSQAGSGKRILNEIGSGIERCVMPHIALADFSRELLHIRAELFAQHNFIGRQRPRL